jgi:hypothetical protein
MLWRYLTDYQGEIVDLPQLLTQLNLSELLNKYPHARAEFDALTSDQQWVALMLILTGDATARDKIMSRGLRYALHYVVPTGTPRVYRVWHDSGQEPWLVDLNELSCQCDLRQGRGKWKPGLCSHIAGALIYEARGNVQAEGDSIGRFSWRTPADIESALDLLSPEDSHQMEGIVRTAVAAYLHTVVGVLASGVHAQAGFEDLNQVLSWFTARQLSRLQQGKN